MNVERLDFSKPPPGFNLDDLPRHLTMTVRTAGVWGPNVIAAAWAHHKARHDAARLLVDHVIAAGMPRGLRPFKEAT